MDNYCDWDGYIPLICVADDGFGNLVETPLDAFWFNNDRQFENLH